MSSSVQPAGGGVVSSLVLGGYGAYIGHSWSPDWLGDVSEDMANRNMEAWAWRGRVV